MSRIADLKIKIFADGADDDGIVKMSRNPAVKGFTTNPSLMRKAGVSDYEAFARKVLAAIPDRPVSFEVFADDFASMAEQAGQSWRGETKAQSHSVSVVSWPSRRQTIKVWPWSKTARSLRGEIRPRDKQQCPPFCTMQSPSRRILARALRW